MSEIIFKKERKWTTVTFRPSILFFFPVLALILFVVVNTIVQIYRSGGNFSDDNTLSLYAFLSLLLFPIIMASSFTALVNKLGLTQARVNYRYAVMIVFYLYLMFFIERLYWPLDAFPLPILIKYELPMTYIVKLIINYSVTTSIFLLLMVVSDKLLKVQYHKAGIRFASYVTIYMLNIIFGLVIIFTFLMRGDPLVG